MLYYKIPILLLHIIKFLICKLSLLSSNVLFFDMAFLLNSDHPEGGCLKDVSDGWDRYC